MGDFSHVTDRELLKLRADKERERMNGHYSHNDWQRKSAVKRLKEIDKEIERRRTINRTNRNRKS